ncbi:MAG: SprT family zinc-dependent metalloprotease [bacterium]
MNDIKIDKIIRSKRRTIGIEITSDASLIVRVPLRTSLEHIKKIVDKKRFWIQKKQKTAKEKKSIPRKFVEGEKFLYLGNTYRLYIFNNPSPPLLFNQKFLLSRDYLPYAQDIFVAWYKNQAYYKIKERLDWYSTLSGLKYNGFKITNARKRWGSCNGKDRLCFSWRLIMTPLSVIDYVVVHELTHIVEKNHSKRFWHKLKIILPNYEESKKWLKENEYLLGI